MDTDQLIDSVPEEETDPLASSGTSVSSYEDGLPGKNRRKSKSALTRLRKLKKSDTNGPVSNFTPHPPAGISEWNSPQSGDQSLLIPNGVNHLPKVEESPEKEERMSPAEIDPFTGEIKKTRKKDSSQSIGEEPLSLKKVEELQEKIDPFTGAVIRTKKKQDPFTTAGSINFQSGQEEETETDFKSDPFTGKKVRNSIRKDPFTALNSIDFNSPSQDSTVDPLTGEKRRTSKRRDPFTAMNSIDFDSSSQDNTVDPLTGEKERTSKGRDPFTAMNSIDFDSSNQGNTVDPITGRRTLKEREHSTVVNSTNFDSTTKDDKKDVFTGKSLQNYERIDPSKSSFSKQDTRTSKSTNVGSPRTQNQNDTFPPMNGGFHAADDETGEQIQGHTINDLSAKSNASDNVEGVIVAAEESKVESMGAKVYLTDGKDLLKSTDTDIVPGDETTLPPLAQPRLSTLKEQSSQEQTSLLRPLEYQNNQRLNNRSPLLYRRTNQSEPKETLYTSERAHEAQVRLETSEETVSEIEKTQNQETEKGGGKEETVEIEDESDSDDLVVIPDSSKKAPTEAPSPQTLSTEEPNNFERNTETERVPTTSEHPVATSTPSKQDGVSQGVVAANVPALNLEGVIRSDEEPDDEGGDGDAAGNKVSEASARKSETYDLVQSVDSQSEDEAIASSSDVGSVGSDTLKVKNHMVAQQADIIETESEIIVRRKSRTRDIPDIRASSSESAGESGSSDIVRRGRLSPITPQKHPPPLEENFSSLVLRTCYKKDNLSSSMVLSEPLMRSTEELSDTNRSFLSMGALPQISTKKARNRSFLSGGMRTSGSLLGREELERFFPDRKLRIFVATWNMCELKILPDNLEDLLLPEHSECDDIVHDMYVIGTQESSADGSEWAISLQETLGPSHVLLQAINHGVLRLLIFIRRDLIWFCSPVEEDRVSTRPGSMIKTKGAVAASFTFFGTSFLFINAHFTSGDENMQDRLLDYDKICKGLQLPIKVEPTRRYNVLTTDVTTRFDCVFWFGDFNFRLVESRKKVEIWANQLRDGTKSDYNILLELDQLKKAMNKKMIFKGFHEGAIEFIPTYKFDIGEDIYDTSEKKRVPSYTDRILFKSRKKCDIAVLNYMSCDDIKASDHRPVYGVYQVNIRPGKEDMTLGGGQFNREVFIEANKRRAARAGMFDKLNSQQNSSVCAVIRIDSSVFIRFRSEQTSSVFAVKTRGSTEEAMISTGSLNVP